jgi:hypothetical protein
MTTQAIFEVAAAIIVSLGGGAALVFGLSSFLGKTWAARILERERSAYATELETLRRTYSEELEHVRSALQKSAFEHQTRFSWYHQRKAELIANVYFLLNEVTDHVRHMVSPVQFGTDESKIAHRKATIDVFNKLAREYWGKKIFLEKEICLKVEAILKAVNEAITNFEISQDPQTRDVKLWGAAYKQMDKNVPPLLGELEESFRVMLSNVGPAT